MSLPPSSLLDSDTNGRGSTCCGSGVSCHPIPNLPGPVRHDVSISAQTLFKLRREADLWKTVYGFKKNVLGSQALSDLNNRWEDLTKTALEIEASLAADETGQVEMETAPLDTAEYIQEGDQAKINLLHGRFQRTRQGQVVRELKELKRPSQSSAEPNIV